MSDTGKPKGIEAIKDPINREELFRLLFAEFSEGVFVIESEGKILTVNPQGLALTGYSEEELQSLTVSDLINKRDSADDPFPPGGLQPNRTVVLDRRIRRKNGIWFPVTASFQGLSGGKILARIIQRGPHSQTKIDTEQIVLGSPDPLHTELRLKESEEKYRQLFDVGPDALLFADTETQEQLEVNEAALGLYGYSREEFLRLPVTAISAEPEATIKTLQNGIRHIPLRWHVRKDGSVFPVEINTRTFEWQGRRVQFGSVRDISERLKNELKLRLTQFTIDHSSDAVFWIDEQARIFYVNQAACKILGYSQEELLNLTMADISPKYSQDFWVSYWFELKAKGDMIFDTTYRSKEGRVYPVEIRANHIETEGREFCCIFARDITERQLAEEEKEKLQMQLVQAQKMESIGRLAGGVAHDFNNMLSAILGHAEMAIMRCRPEEEIYTDLEAIHQSGQRSAELVRQLLAFARKQPVEPKVLDLNDTVAGMLKMLQRLIGEDIDLSWMPGKKLWPVIIDPSQIDQILANLCLNARDAIPGMGKITIKTENRIIDKNILNEHPEFVPGNYVLLSVRDDGSGMNEEILAHLFEPFFTTKAVGKGTGLGLATVYGIVKQNQGFIFVESEPGRGSLFRVYLPRYTGKILEPAPESIEETLGGRGETILLVEDEKAILNLFRVMLEKLGYKILTAGTPTEALRLATDHAAELQLLITDVVMPEMNGRELARLIEKINPGVKTLFTSGYTADVIANHGVLDVGVHFLQKPISFKKLASTVRQTLDQV
jgi:PAS domain S-box-containing protein